MPTSQLSKRLIISGSLLLVLSIGLTYNMWSLHDNGLLWGYRPLIWLLSTWFGFVFLVQSRRLKKGQAYPSRSFALSTLSGVLLAVGFPDIIPAPFLLFIGFVPLLILESELDEGAKKRQFLRHAFHAFLVWNIIATYWVMNTAFVAGLFANIANSFLMCIPWFLYMITKKQLPRLGYISLIAYWLCFEYMHLQWDLTWPWLNLGNGWAQQPYLIQWYEYLGVFGGSLWIWVANILAFHLWKTRKSGSIAGVDFLKIGSWVLIPMAISIFMYFNYENAGDEIDVVVVQPNYEPHFEKFDIRDSEQVKRFISLSLTQLDNDVDYLVFPETSFGLLKEDNVWNDPNSNSLFENFSQFSDLKLITGLSAYHDLRPEEERTSANRQRDVYGKMVDYEIFNLAAQMPLNREIEAQTYRKSKMVPGAESFPFKKILFFMEPLVHQLGGSVAGLGSQPKRSVFSSSTASIAPVICYESIFGEYFTGYIKAGAQAAFIMTNDGWWDNTAGHRQHLYYASLRAIETRRSIARSANTGVSAFINQRGDILNPTSYNEAVAIRGKIKLNTERTVYVRMGDIIARIAIFTSILLLLNTFVKGRIKKE